jgi:hypothetical protein
MGETPESEKRGVFRPLIFKKGVFLGVKMRPPFFRQNTPYFSDFWITFISWQIIVFYEIYTTHKIKKTYKISIKDAK